jgi:3-oxoacyl-[acyl-carrier protein] reductase
MPEEQKELVAQMTPLGRNALPEDIAGTVMLPAGDDACCDTGAHVPVCGGPDAVRRRS